MDRLVRTLLIEDELYAIERITQILKEYNFIEFEIVSDCKKAKEKLELTNWDIVITTTFIYGLSAAEVNHIAKEKNKEVCVIVISGLSSVDIAQKCVREGAFDYVLKPQDIERLRSLIKIYVMSKK